MKTRLKKYLNKHKNRIFSLIAVMVFIPMFSFNAFASSVVLDLYQYYLMSNSLYIGAFTSGYFNEQGVKVGGGSRLFYVDNVSINADGYYYVNNNDVYNNVNALDFEVSSHLDTYPVVNDLYDYYVVATVNFTDVSNSSNIFYPDYVNITKQFNGAIYNYSYEDFTVTPISSLWSQGFQVSFKVDFTDYVFFDRILFRDNSNGTVGKGITYNCFILPVLKNTSDEELQSIITAINNQTSTLGGKIDDTNDFINHGNGSTGGIVSNNNSAADNLNEVVSEYHATEQQFFDDFTANQQAINSDIVGWSWGGLVNCANWVGETMTDYYNNMGDFRQYIIYPLMLGIVLFFLGRGGAIIGHLFRKPTQSTVNIESTSFKRGNTRYTTTTTSKRGGVFRK